MNDPEFPWLSVIAAVPLVGAALVAAVPRGRETLAKQLAVGVSLVVLALVVAMGLQFDVDEAGTFQFQEFHKWIPDFGVSYALGVDGISIVLLALVAVLTPV